MKLLLAALFAPVLFAQSAKPPLVRENATIQVSEHVWVIPDDHVPMVPNVGIVIGQRAILVVDTGLGPRNAQTILREVDKLAKRPELYLVTTHFHPEHAGGSSGFPARTKFIVSKIQQQDLDELGMGMMESFSRITPLHAELLKDVRFRKADLIFDEKHTIQLGGLDVELLSLGGTHTRGDTLAFVRQDRVLFSGDIVMNRAFLSFGKYGGVQHWIDVLNRIDQLKAVKLVPSHYDLGDGSLTGQQRQVLEQIQTRVRDLKDQGKSAEDCVPVITTELQAKYPDWVAPNRLAPAIRTAYAEAK